MGLELHLHLPILTHLPSEMSVALFRSIDRDDPSLTNDIRQGLGGRVAPLSCMMNLGHSPASEQTNRTLS